MVLQIGVELRGCSRREFIWTLSLATNLIGLSPIRLYSDRMIWRGGSTSSTRPTTPKKRLNGGLDMGFITTIANKTRLAKLLLGISKGN